MAKKPDEQSIATSVSRFGGSCGCAVYCSRVDTGLKILSVMPINGPAMSMMKKMMRYGSGILVVGIDSAILMLGSLRKCFSVLCNCVLYRTQYDSRVDLVAEELSL